MRPIQTILHPTDFSARAQQAFELACALARDHNARLIVMHVLERPSVVTSGVMMAPPPPPAPAEERAIVKQKLESYQAADANIRVEHRFEEGDPVAGILFVAKEEKCDLIVLGTHGRTGLSRLLMGSVAEKVLRQAPCPVLVLKGDGVDLATPPSAAGRPTATVTSGTGG